MVEFGEQLRRARERKGMTQQSLAEKLFVTRQSVSRWECGDRYPDLLMTKNISKILEVSLDELLSDDDMEKMVKRNPIIEKPAINKMILLLYGAIAVLYMSMMVDLMIRLPSQSEQMSVLLTIPAILQTCAFIYGFIAAIKQSLSPMRTRVIVSIFFLSLALKDSYYLFLNQPVNNVLWVYLLMLPNVLGTLAAVKYFIQSRTKNIWLILLYMTCISGMLRLIHQIYNMMIYLGEFLTMNNTVNYIISILIYILIMYQTSMYKKKLDTYRKVN